MGARVTVVSLGRIIADQVRIEPTEAYAVLQRLWEHVAGTRDADGALAPLPGLDAVGITAFGDVAIRHDGRAPRHPAAPELVTRDLSGLLRRLLVSGRGTRSALPAQVVAACRGAVGEPDTEGDAPRSPAVLLDALAPYRPADPASALAMVFARWMRTTDGGAIRGASGRSGA